MKRFIPFLSLVYLLTVSPTLYAQDEEEEKWDVTDPGGPHKEVTITTDEGTWMNLDVSPNGEEIVFDLLGDIYIMPIGGGEAELLREGLAYAIQPRFSPDGSQISFTSDAGGADNIWVMDRDGSDARQVTKEDFRLLNNAVWSPEGDYLIAKKHFTSTRSLGAGELWLYHKSGGSGVQLVEKNNEQQDLGQPYVSPDGRYVYYSESVYPGGHFQYNKDPNSQIYQIQRYDRETGETERITGGTGGAISPTISPDGKKMAFVRRVRTKSVLYIHDLETGVEKPVYDQLSKDQQEAWAIFGPYTNMDWTPDGEHLVFWAKGKIHKLNVETLEEEVIPFKASAKHKIYDAVSFTQDPAPEEFTAKAIRHAVTSPDGKLLVFNAAGKLWKKELPNGTPQRLTDSNYLEFEPAFSPSGDRLIYTTWSDTAKGAIKSLSLNESDPQSQKITEEKGIYRNPSFSPEGNTILFRLEDGNDHQGHTYTKDTGIYTMPANGGERQLVTEEGTDPQFSADGKRIFFLGGSYLDNAFKSVDLSGNDERTHFTSKYANNFVVSPDNKWVAFNELFKVYIAPFPQTGIDITLSADTDAIPVTHVAEDAGMNLHWSADSESLHWTLGEEYFSVSLQNAFNFLEEGAQDSDRELPLDVKEGTAINLELQFDKPTGTIALTGGRIITIDDQDRVIEKGTVIVNENLIEAVGPAGEVEIPSGAEVIDVSGKTIMPGIVDVHAHIGNFRQGLSPQQQWEYFANLAYGVTTAHDPSANSDMIFSQAEMVKAGNMVGARIFSTGRILYGADAEFKAVINSYEDAKSAIERTKAYGAFSVKSYNQPRRNQRQQVMKAARELEVMVMPEGGSTFTHNMSMILDGHTGIEHNIPIYPAYDDVKTLWGESGTGYTPTLVVNYGSVSGEYYWYQHTKVWEKERLLNFTPRSIVDSRSRHRKMIPQEEYEIGHIESASLAKELYREGVTVNLGAHGQLQGLGAHWELWMFHQGGMTAMEALRTATINGAEYIGMDHAFGSIEEGKLADLIVLDGNPLEDIRQTENVRYTMVNGRLYDSATMNEIGNHPQKRLPFWWEQEGYNPSHFDWHADTNARTGGVIQCSCGLGMD
ncbi:amidohydrolase family protein [Aliifodinibius sp. S!AR15-10]|uniref:amidohydrolase family protein n=1 Tax=Aliifodinibius sp. S!AR15-10 TaxID=2950437 RepID=UPI002856189F|nr:amidohydrolase family protein [Aliifodinibius sp. S!AR15-10]MDR8392322.1 amidohydrolase family protein [Aliifodinibius sp. S!AR15-10]